MSHRTGPRILIVRLGAIGDVINSTVLLYNLRKHWPDAFIAWAVHPLSAPMLEGNPDLDMVLVIDRKDIPLGFHRIRALLKPLKFDFAIDLQKLFKSAMITWLSGAPRRLGYDISRAKELSWLLTNQKLSPRDPQRHVVDQVMEFSELLGLDSPEVGWSVPVHDGDRTLARELLEGVEKPVALLGIGASEKIKRWTADGFAQVAIRLRDHLGYHPLILCGPSAEERALSASIQERVTGRLDSSEGRGPLRQILGLMERAQLFVGGDTGPLHLAAAMSVPTIGLYGAQNPDRSGPYGWRDRVVFKSLPCSPCMKSTCHLGTIACMTEMTAEDVIARIPPPADPGKGPESFDSGTELSME